MKNFCEEIDRDEWNIIEDNNSDNYIVGSDNIDFLKIMADLDTKIDVFYLDPPYNTKKHFSYKDSHGSHDEWLLFMKNRLTIVHDTLKDSGFIFISIDDSELLTTLSVCNEIFGEENFVANIVWQRFSGRKNMSKYFSVNHEYIVVYAKNKKECAIRLLKRKETDTYSNPDNDPNGPWASSSPFANKIYHADYTIKAPDGTIYSRPEGMFWRYSEETIKEKIKNNEIIWSEDRSGFYIKRYLKDVKDGLIPTTWWDAKFAGDNSSACKEIKSIFDGKKVIDYPKPTLLIKRILEISCPPDGVVCDCFAGTGTTGQAVFDMNQSDGGTRKVILIQKLEKIRNMPWLKDMGYKNTFEICIKRMKHVREKVELASLYGDFNFNIIIRKDE